MNRLAPLVLAVAASFTLPACAHQVVTPAGVGSLARVTVIDRTANRELPVHWKDGQAYIAGTPGNEYQVRVRNVAGEDLLAVVSVDGVNAVTGETAATTQGGYVVGSYQSLDVSGWRKSLRNTAAFYFTPLPDSYAARTGRPDEVGVIGVALFKRRPPEPATLDLARPAPFAKQEAQNGAGAPESRADASAPGESPAKRAAPASPLGTGHGRVERNPSRWVQFERATAYPIETIVIRYDSHRNLLAQGVIAPPHRPRDPNPFPGFVPDPA